MSREVIKGLLTTSEGLYCKTGSFVAGNFLLLSGILLFCHETFEVACVDSMIAYCACDGNIGCESPLKF